MAKDTGHSYIDPLTAAFYGMSAVLAAIYLFASAMSFFDRNSFPPLFRIILFILAGLSAYLGARLPRKQESADRALCRKRVRHVMWGCFALYLHLVLTFTLFDPGMGRNVLGFLHATAADRAYYMEWHVNLKPFATIHSVYLIGYRGGLITLPSLLLNLAGNFLVFAPLAFFLPYLFRRIGGFLRFLAITLAAVLLIELCQLLLMCGAFDIDDILLNVGGAVFFWFFLKLPPLRRFLDLLTVA